MDGKKKSLWIWIGLSFVWIAFVYASFYLVQQQRPFEAANLLAIGSTLLDLLVAGLIFLVGVGLGHRICRWLGIRFDHAGERIVLSCGVGLGALSFLVLGVGLLGWLRRWVMALLFGGLALLLLSDLVAIGRAVASLRAMSRPKKGLSLYLGGTLLLALLVALTPPAGGWDGLFYHLTMPKLYIEQGRIAPVTDIPHQYFPGLMEMLYLAAMLLKGDVAAKLLHFGYVLLLAGVVYLLARRHVGPGYGWLSVTVYAAIPMVSVLGSWAYNDLALSFYQIAALYALFNWFRDDRLGSLTLSAVFCGLAMGLKYTAFVCPLAVAILIAWHLARKRASWGAWRNVHPLGAMDFRRTCGLRALLCFGGVTLLVAAPWYLRNLIFTGNPVYPFAYGLFGGRGWDEWRAAWYARSGSGLGWNPFELLKLPWTLTLGIRDMNFYDGRTGPLFLLALPFLIAWIARFFGRSDSRPRAVGYVIDYLVVFALIQFLSWCIGVINSQSLFQSRLLLPAFVALCVPLAYLFDELRAMDTRFFSLRRLVGMSVVLVLAANLCYQFLDTLRTRPLPVLVGEESREAFLMRNLGAHYAAMELMNERVAEDGRVLFMWEPRSYYCQRAAQPDPILERWAWLRHRYGDDLAGIARSLQDEGYTHLLLHRAGLERAREIGFDSISDADVAALEAFVADYLDQEGNVGEAYLLYRLRDSYVQE